jgi:RHS repeat-associated protein
MRSHRSRRLQLVAVLGSMMLVAFTSVRAKGSWASEPVVEDVAEGEEAPVAAPSAESRDAAARTWASVSVTPDNQSSGNVDTTTSGYSAGFTVSYWGDEMDPPETFDLWCSGTNGIQCSVQSTLELWPNFSDGVTVSFSTGSQTGTGYVYLYASGQYAGYDSGSRYYQIGPPVIVTSVSVPSSVVQHSKGHLATFDVKNNTGSGATFTMTCEWIGGCTTKPSSKSIGAGATIRDTVLFDAGAVAATHALKLTATGGGNSGSKSNNVGVTEFLSVNAVSKHAEVYAVPGAQRTDTFMVRFPGQQSASSFSMSVSCAGSLSNCSVHNDDQTKSVADAPVPVRVTYTAGSNGTSGTVTLTATKVGSSWMSQSGSFKVTATSSILLSVEDANPGLDVDRGDCVTVAAGPGAIVCDDYQFVYPFTPVSRMNQARQIGLIHNSALRYPLGVIGANFVLPPGAATPDSVRATLVVNGVTIRTQYYGSAAYARGQKTRIAFDWSQGTYSNEQLLKYDVTLETKSGGAWGSSVTKSGKFLSLHHGTRYGRGWWIAGLEKLSVHGSDTLIWTGGDASGGVYLKNGSGKWIRQTRSVPDTITQSGGEYIRRLIGGGEVRFNSSGFHTKTVDRNLNETRFNYTDTVGWTRLTSVELPKPTGRDTVYTLHYNPSHGGLDSVRVRNGTGGWSRFRIYSRNVSGQGLHIDSIQAPDGLKTRLVGSNGQLNTIYGPRGDTTALAYTYYKVSSVTIKTFDIDDVVLDYRASSTIGRAGSGWRAPAHVDSVSTRIDGPLPGAADTTRFFVTAWGGVRGVRDALFNATWIDRTDAAFPALPTRVRHPNGWEVTAAYTNVGLPDTIIDRSNGAMTTYQWNNTWAAPTQIKSPEGVVTAFTYDGSGNRTKQALGTDTVRFFYRANGLVDSIADPTGYKTKLGYDTYGNVSTEFPPDSMWTHYHRDYRGYDTLVARPTGDKPIASTDSLMVTTRRDVMGRDTLVITWNRLDSLRTMVRTTYEYGQLKKVEPLGADWTGSQWDTTRLGASEWIYDDLGRARVAITPATADTMTFDLAGNVTKMVSHADTVSMTYDAIGRMLTRRSSKRSYSYGTIPLIGWTFPHYHPSGLTIDTTTDVFTYDPMGNLRTARNQFARTTRTYALNGALETEVDSLRNYGSSSFATHVYERSYAYDRDGRRVNILHPTWINGGTDRTDYRYDPVTGRLSSVIDALGNVFGFAYDANGQTTVRTAPSVVDSMLYYPGGLLRRMKTVVAGSGSWGSDIRYDNAGRLIPPGTENAYAYNGLGHAWLYQSGDGTEESYRRDPFGNAVFRHVYGPLESPQTSPGSAFLTGFSDWGGRAGASTEQWVFETSPTEPTGWIPSSKAPSYDARGNMIGVTTDDFTWSFSGGVHGYDDAEVRLHHRSMAQSYYAGDGKLRYHQVNRDSLVFKVPDPTPYNGPDTLTWGAPWGAWEEYWYDALGRRVLKRTRQESPICTHSERCYSAIERYVWDGDQILWEFRQADTTDTKDPNPTPSNGQTGHVGYVHGGGIDVPISMIRNDTTIVLQHHFHTGLFYNARTTDGSQFGNEIPWPAISWTLQQGSLDPRKTHTWVGSLPIGQQDHSGLNYRRNRYYDPTTGQFTQQDPIGIAGGLNLYGYANGDPINFSDPFGLCPKFITGKPCPFNGLKAAVGLVNAGRGTMKLARGGAAMATLAGAPVGALDIAGGLSGWSRGLQQFHESLNDPNGPTLRNLLGLLPAGQEFDDPGEPTFLEFVGEKLDEARSFADDPRGRLGKWLREYFAICRDEAGPGDAVGNVDIGDSQARRDGARAGRRCR